MAERRARHQDSPRRRKRESTKAIIDQDELPRTRAPYQSTEIPSSYSSSSSYIDISRTFPPNRPRGLGAIRAFFTSPSEHRRRPRRRTSRPYLRAGSSSSSSINTDLAYGSGYIRRRKSDRRRRKGKDRDFGDRQDPRVEKDPDTAILEVGASLAALARKQNRLDLAEMRRQGIAPPRRSDSSILKGAESSRGLGASKVSHGPDEEGWESATDADSETSSVDSRLAYGHENGPGWGGFFRSKPKRKESVVDPKLFGPANSLHGIIHEPVGFDEVDYDNLSDFPPPTVAALQKEQNYPPQIPAPQRDQDAAIGSASATGSLQYVYPVPTSDPTRFDAVRGSAVSAQEPNGSRPAPVPIQQGYVEIKQPQPKPIVSQSVFEPPYSTRSEPKVPSSSGRTKSSVAEAALAGVTGAVIGAAASSGRRDERKDRDRREDVRDEYEGERRAERRKDETRERSDMKETADGRREKRRERDRDRPEESREERRERRRREKRDDPDYERREKRRERRREDEGPDDRVDIRREEKYTGRPSDRDNGTLTEKVTPIVAPIDPFQYQVADDAFKTPDGTRNSEPFTSIQRARSPAVVTVERVPHWHRDALTKEETVKPTDDTDREEDLEARDRQQTEREAASLYEEIEHSTIPVEASAVGAAIVAEEHRHSREKVRKRRYDRSGDASPTGEKDPIQEEADRIYREAVLARKIAEGNNDDSVVHVVTPPEMAHNKDKEILYPVPNADFELDHVMDPVEFMASPIKGPGEGFDRIKSLSGVALEDLKRPLLTLVRPTPTPSPAPEQQKSRSKRKDSSREAESSDSKKSERRRKDSSREVEPSDPEDRKSEHKESSPDIEPSGPQRKPAVDTVETNSKGGATQTPTSANGTKGVTWGENDTKHFEVETPYETKDDPIATDVKASDDQEKPKMSNERKASAWGAIRGAFMSGVAADVVAKATEVSKDDKDMKVEKMEKDVGSERTDRDNKLEKKSSSGADPFEYRGVVVMPEHSDNGARQQDPPAVGPKPLRISGSNMPGAFDDDLDFTATLAAGLEDSGFDPNIVIKDPTYRRRSSPPGSEDPALAGYKQPYAETVSELSQYAAPSTEKPRDIKPRNDDIMDDRTEKERKKLDKAAKRQSSETRDIDLSGQTPSSQIVEEPETFLESSKSSKKDKKRDKTKKSKDSFEDVDDRSSKRVSVPVDAFDDLRDEAVEVEVPQDWETPKKSKRKSKRDSDLYDSPSRSMSASDMASSVELSKKKPKDKSSKKSIQYDSEPNPEDIPLPSASEISRDDDYDSRKSKRSSKRSGSIPDVVDRDARSVKSDSSRYADDDDSRSSKKEKRNSGFFSGIFGSSTSKSEPERSKDTEQSESKKKTKKSKRNSAGDGSETYDGGDKSDVKSSPNGNGFYDDDEGDQARSTNGNSKHGEIDEKESFLDNAGTLGAGVGLAAAISLAAQHQQTKAATAEIEERVPRRSTPEHASSAKVPAIEASRGITEQDIVDPDIVQRQFRPSIDPQYGDLLPLPPSDPGSPNVEAGDALPSLPESRPNTPPKNKSTTTRDRSVGSGRRSELPALVKTPSHSAVPIKFIMGNRSTPSSPGLVRAPSMSSPSTMSPDTLGFHRARPRPTSWDSTKEIQPLYLLDPSRRAPASQSTDSEVQSPVVEDVIKSTQIDEAYVQESQNQVPVSGAEFPDPTTLPALPNSRTLTPIERVAHESDIPSLPPLPESGISTPGESSELSRLPRLPDSRSSTPVEDQSLQKPDLATAGLLTGAALDLSVGAMALASNHDDSAEAGEALPMSMTIGELPTEFQVEPITKDRSSYLFQATPPAKRIKDVETESPSQIEIATSSRIVEEVSPPNERIVPHSGSPTQVFTPERETTLEALTRSKSDEGKSLESFTSAHPVMTRELEIDHASVTFAKPKKDKSKDKKNRVDSFRLEDEPLSSTVTPPSMADSSKAIEGPPEFSVKRSKIDKKKDKKRASSQRDAEDEVSESIVLEQEVAVTPRELDLVDEPSQSVSTLAPQSTMESAEEQAEAVEAFSKSKREKKKDKKRAPTLVQPKDEASSNTDLSPPVGRIIKPADAINGPLEHLSANLLSSSAEPAESLETDGQHSLDKSNQDKEQDQERVLDPIDTNNDSFSSDIVLPSTKPQEETEIADFSSQLLPSVVFPASTELPDDVETLPEPSLKKSKKDKKKGKKKALDWIGGEEVLPISAVPSSLASATQEPYPSDENSSTTSKKGKKKDKKNRKNLSGSSTLVEPGDDVPMDIFDTNDADSTRGEQTLLPISRALSEAEAPSEASGGDIKTRDILSNQEENLQLAEPFTGPASAKEPPKGKKKARKSLTSWKLDEPSPFDPVANEPTTEAPLTRESDNTSLESKDINDTQPQLRIEPQAEIDTIKGSKNNEKKGKSERDRDIENPLVSGPVEGEPAKGQLVPDETLRDALVHDEGVKGEPVQKDIIEAQAELGLSVVDKSVEEETLKENALYDFHTTDEHIEGDVNHHSLGIKNSSTKDTASKKDNDQNKPAESLPESNSAKDSKNNKKKKGKSFQAWQDDEAPDSQTIADPVSEPTTGVPSEREDMSGFSTPTSKSKGKKKLKRKSITWDLQEPEPGKEVASPPKLESEEPISRGRVVKDEPGYVHEPESREDVTSYEPEFVMKDIEKSPPHIDLNVLSTTPTESEPFNATQSDSSGIRYFPSAIALHTPSSAEPTDGSRGKGYLPSTITLLPLVGAATVHAAKHHQEQEPLSNDVQEEKEPSISRNQEYDDHSLSTADHRAVETTFSIPLNEISDPIAQVAEEQEADSKPSTLYSQEQLEAARQLNAEFSSGKKKSKKSKRDRADLSRTSTQDDNFPTESMNEPEELKDQVGLNLEVSAGKDFQGPDGLAAGYKEDEIVLAKQLQAEYDSSSKKSKKGKKSRSTSRTPRDYDSGPSFFEEPEAADTQPVREVSRGIIPEDEHAPRKQGTDGFAAGFTEEQVEAAREMREAFTTGSKKSKKDKKRKSLIRTATDENVSGPTAEGGFEETSLATTEVDSGTDSPYPLSAVPTPDDFGPSFATKKGKKGKKRQSLLRSFTQDSENSGPNREIMEPEEMGNATFNKVVANAADIVQEPIVDPEDKSSSAVVGNFEAFSGKNEKKGKKKRESLLSTVSREETTSYPPAGILEVERIPLESGTATTSQAPDVVADDDMAALGEELNFNLKKPIEGKEGRKGKDIDEVLAETDNLSQPAEQNIVTEVNILPKVDLDPGSLADRIWAGVMSNESIQPETEDRPAQSRDPLDLYATKNSKKDKKKGQAKSTTTSELDPLPADRDTGDLDVVKEVDNKEPPTSWADEVAEAEVEKKQPKLFDTWSFENLPLDTPAQSTLAEPNTMPKEVEVAREVVQEEQPDKSRVSIPLEQEHPNDPLVHEQHLPTEDAEPAEDLETPPPEMPAALAWEDEPTLQQGMEFKNHGSNDLSLPIPDSPGDSGFMDKSKHGVAKPVSAGILAAGAALLAEASVGHSKDASESELLSTDVSRSAIESEKKKEKRPAKLLDLRSLPKDDLFDNPMLWEGAEAQKFGDQAIEDQSEDDTGFWSAPVEKEESSKDEFAVGDAEGGPPYMPHKRERSESLMEVLEPPTALDHTKTPRKHQDEDVPAAIARDNIIEQVTAEERPVTVDSVSRDAPPHDSSQIDKPKSFSQWNDIPEDNLDQSSKKSKEDKKQSHGAAWDNSAKDEKAESGPSYDTPIEPSTPRDIDASLAEKNEDRAQRSLNEELFQTGRNGHNESAKERHRHQEIYLPHSSIVRHDLDDETLLRRQLHSAPPQPSNEGRAKDKHRREESYFPPPPTLPIVIEEEDHKSGSELVSQERGVDDNNRDSAFVTESPVPFQRRKPDDHEYARDSGVHLGDTPMSKEKAHITSADDALARLSWPAVDKEMETVNLKQSQQPGDERSSKSHIVNPALFGPVTPVAVTELAHLATRSPPQKRDEHGENAKFDRSITPNMGRLQTPDHSKYRPGSVGSNRSSGTPPLRRSDRKLSGDLRSLSQRSQANLAKEAKAAERSPATSIININPTANEGRPRVKDMADVYVSHQEASVRLHSALTGPQDGYGEGRIGSPMSPTRPHSMRRRQSMQVLDLEARVEQLAAENRMLAEAKELAEHSLQSSQRATLALADRDAEVDSLKQTLNWLQQEVERLKEVNDGLTSANVTLGRQHNERYGELESQHANATRELEDLRQSHRGLSGGVEDVIMERVATATEEKDREIAQLRQDLEAAHERIREMQREILRAKDGNDEFLVIRDEDYFDNACQQLCQHVQQWVLRFSKFSDMRACRRTNEINDEKIIDRLDNAVLDGSDVDEYLSDRVKRRDIFMSMTMTMIWEFVFTRYLFGMDREQRQKLKSLEKTLLEVGPPAAVHQWRATTLTLLSKRDAFQQQREQDTVAVVQMIFQTLSEILPPPTHLEEQIQEQLMRVMKSAVDLSIEMRTQRAEYMMLPPLQPEYDANGDLARQVQFNAALMNERSGDTVSNEELEAQHAVVRIVLFPLVVKKGDDTGGGDDEIVVCPAQVLVAKPKRHARGLTPDGMGQNPNHSRVSMQSSMPVDQQVPDI